MTFQIDSSIQIIKNIVVETMSEFNIKIERIVLFGSRSRGTAKPESDYDILIITENFYTVPEKMSVSKIIRKKSAKYLFAVDIMLMSENEIKYLSDKPGNVVRNSLKEGITL